MLLHFKQSTTVLVISFLSWSGFYAGLALFHAIGDVKLSRYFTVPVKVIACWFMLRLLIMNWKRLMGNPYLFFVLMVICFWILYFLNVVINAEHEILRLHWYEYILYALMYCVIPFISLCSIDFSVYIEQVYVGFIYSGLTLGIIATWLYSPLLLSGISRISMAIYDNPDASFLSPLALSYCASTTITACVAYIIFRDPTTKFRRLIFLTIAVSFIMFLLGASRGSVLNLMASFLILIGFGNAKVRNMAIFYLIILLISLFLGALYTGSGVIERVLDTSSDITDGNSSAERIYIWMDAIRYILVNPIIGGRIEMSDGAYPHSFVLEVLMSTGVIGGVLLFIPVSIGVLQAVKVLKKHNEFLPLLLLVQGLIMHSFSGSITVAIMIFFPLGLVYSYAIATNPKKTQRFKTSRYIED